MDYGRQGEENDNEAEEEDEKDSGAKRGATMTRVTGVTTKTLDRTRRKDQTPRKTPISGGGTAPTMHTLA